MEDVTEEDLELCEVVCQPTKVKECAKISNGETDEDGLQIWRDDPDNCIELEKTECKVQERPLEEDENATEEPASTTTATTSTTEECKKIWKDDGFGGKVYVCE